VRQATREAGVLLIVDEIQTGCGRTGRFLACERDGIVPDIVCLGKGLGGGIPVGATAVSPAVAEQVRRGIHTSTFGGNPLACAGALAVLSLLSDAQMASVADSGARFMARLNERVGATCEVRGRGLMVGVVVGPRRDEVLKGLQRRGIIAIPAGSDVVRFLPPFVASAEDLDRAADALGETVREG
jgi:acetylornithine/succinyldiaminopimelate/putrescine aminotransferase